jgi:hypothetical protein
MRIGTNTSTAPTPGIDPVEKRSGDICGDFEHGPHQGEEDGYPEVAIGENGVDPVGAIARMVRRLVRRSPGNRVRGLESRRGDCGVGTVSKGGAKLVEKEVPCCDQVRSTFER